MSTTRTRSRSCTRTSSCIRRGVADIASRAIGHVACLAAIVAVAIVLVVAAVPGVALARDYSIIRVNIDATVGTDGTIQVVEDRTFSFDGSFHGVYWEIPDESKDSTDFNVNITSVGVMAGDNYHEFKNSYASTDGCYSVSSATSDSGTSVQKATLYWSANDEDVTYRIYYTITGGVNAWSDCGELYWMFVSDGWDVPSENVTCTIHLPVASGASVKANDNVLMWAHGPLNGQVNADGNDIVLTVPEVGTGEFAEVRLTFPVAWLSQMTPSSTAKLDSITSEENSQAAQTQQQRDLIRIAMIAACAIPVILALLTLVRCLTSWQAYKRNHESPFTGEYFRDIPSDDHPAVLGCLLNDGSVGQADLTASLMRLTDEHAVGLDQITTTKKGLLGEKSESDYRLVYNEAGAAALDDPVDKATLRFLFDEVWPLGARQDDAGRKVLLFSDISSVAEEHTEEYSSAMEAWEDAITKRCTARKFFADSTESGERSLKVLGSIDAVVGFAIMFMAIALFESFLITGAGLVLFLISFVAFFVVSKMDDLSPEAVEIRAKLLALRKWLKEFTLLDEAVPNDVVLWNRLLVMAVVLGVAEEVIDQLKVAMPQLLENDAFMPTYGWYVMGTGFASPASTFGGAYATAAHVSAAEIGGSNSSFGGGGGFSGGGGFGGGGGGGAF